MSLLETQHLTGEEAVQRFGICCCPDTHALNQRWRVRVLDHEADPIPSVSYLAYCETCGRPAGADR